MKGYLLDTNVLSEFVKKRPAQEVVDRLRSVSAEALYTSVICVMELRYGARRRGGKAQLWERIVGEVLPAFQVLPLGLEAALRSGEILAELESRGELIGIEDILIGATALQHQLTVVTRNVKHLERIPELEVVSWW